MKYLIVDDHALVRSALSMMLLDRDPSAEVLTAGDVPTTLELIGREGETADLLILDLNLPGVEGTELMEEIVRRQPMLKILVLSGLTDRGRIMRVLQLGAAGFVPKSLDTDMLTNAIEFVLRGGVFIPSKLLAESQREGFFSETARSLPHLSSNAPKLTDRQKEFYDLYYNEDLSLAEIAENYGISRQGVRDVIVRAEAIMTDLEDKTGLMKRFLQMQQQVQAILDAAEKIQTVNYRQYDNPELARLADEITRSAQALKE